MPLAARRLFTGAGSRALNGDGAAASWKLQGDSNPRRALGAAGRRSGKGRGAGRGQKAGNKGPEGGGTKGARGAAGPAQERPAQQPREPARCRSPLRAALSFVRQTGSRLRSPAAAAAASPSPPAAAAPAPHVKAAAANGQGRPRRGAGREPMAGEGGFPEQPPPPPAASPGSRARRAAEFRPRRGDAARAPPGCR